MAQLDPTITLANHTHSVSDIVGGSGGGSSSLTVKDEGSALSTSASILNFVGSGVTASGTGVEKTITITAGADRTVTVTVVGDGTTDDGPAIQEALSDVGISDHSFEFIVEAPPTGVIYINSVVQIETSNTTLRFNSPVLFGVNGKVRLQGELVETPDVSKPVLASNGAADATTITLVDATIFSIGDYIVLRGFRDGTGNATQRMNNSVTDKSGNVLTLAEPLDSTYQVTYTAGDYEGNFGIQNKTQITKVTGSKISSNVNRGATTIAVTSSASFAAGDYVQIVDDANTVNPSGVPASTNYLHREIAQVKAVPNGTSIRISHTLHHSYTTADNARVVKIQPVFNSHIRDANVTWSAFGSGAKNAFEMRYAISSSLSNLHVYGTGSYSWDRQAFRISDSFHSMVEKCSARHPAQTGSGQAYGVSVYGSNSCIVSNCFFSSLRHSVLLFNGAAGNIIEGCISDDCCISDYDIHGANAVDNLFTHCISIGGASAADDGSTQKSACRAGNTTHVNGDAHNVFTNMLISNHTGAALEVVTESVDTVFKDSQVTNVALGMRIKSNGSNAALTSSDIRVKNVTFTDVTQLTDIDGSTNDVISDLTIEGCTFVRATTGLTIYNVVNATVVGNTFVDPQQAATVYALTASDVDGLIVTNNVFNGCYRGVKLTDCVSARVTDNTMYDLVDTTVYEDVGGNTNALFVDNSWYGFTAILRTSGAGPSTGGRVELYDTYVSDVPEEHGLIEWNYDPIATGSGSGQIITAGSLYLIKVSARRGGTITSIGVVVGTAGATLTASQCLAGLYDDTGTLIATSTNQATAWQSTGFKVMTLAASVNIQAGRNYYVALFANGTTMPSFVRAGATALSTPNVNQSNANNRFSTNGSSITAMPSTRTLASNSGTGAYTFWVCLL